MGSLIGSITGTTKAAKRAAEAQRQAADMAKYRPYDVEGSFYGDVAFGPDTVSYELSPELQTFRDYFYNQALGFQPSGQEQTLFSDISQTGADIFRRGAETDIGTAAQDYYNQQLRLLQPERTMEDIRLRESLYGTGRGGLGVSLGTGGYVNPEQYGASLAREMANLNLASTAEDRARQLQQQDISMGTGLFGLGREMRLQPITQAGSLLNMASGVEQMGMMPLQLGVDLGSAAQSGRVAQASGYGQAANTRLNASLANAGMFTELLGQAMSIPNWSNMSNPFSNMSNPFSSGGGGGGYQPVRGGQGPNMSYIGGR
jgi:hypothetical protein